MVRMFGFWRSTAAFRVRMALNLKGIAYEETMVDLDAGAQHAAAYIAENPQGKVPLLVMPDGTRLTQSLAILEYLDEIHPAPALLPPDSPGRARVRALALIWAADHHPLIVPRIRTYLQDVAGLNEEQRTAWIRHWFTESLRTGEAQLAADPATGRFCHGDSITLADLCLTSQVASARVFKVDTAAFPTVERIANACLALDPIARAHPLRQPGAPAH